MVRRYHMMSLLRRQESTYPQTPWMPAFAGMTYWIGQFE